MRRAHDQDADAPFLAGEPAVAELALAALRDRGEVDRATHGFHTWPAGLHPDAAARLVRAFGARSVLDPFCGGGTVLVEGRIAGLRTVGRDVSPVARLVSVARAASLSEETLTRVRSVARKLVAEARDAKARPPERIYTVVRAWYAEHVLHELEALRAGISGADADLRPFLWACLSSTLVKVSQRASDTSPERVRKDRPAGTTAVWFHKKVREYGRRVAALRELVPPGTPDADVAICDARRLTLDTPVDLVVTSPPYPSTYDYLPMQQLRNVWLGYQEGSGEIGARRYWRDGGADARREWQHDTAAWTEAVARCVVPGGHVVVVIGDGLTPAGTVDTSQPTEEAARAAGLRSLGRASVERPDHARGAVRAEHCFVFSR